MIKTGKQPLFFSKKGKPKKHCAAIETRREEEKTRALSARDGEEF
jgi:hypothetical protein